MDAAVNVRFFYQQAEKDEIITMATNFAAANTASVEPSQWFKTISGAFVPNSTNVVPDAVLNAFELTDVNSSAQTINGVLYAQFDGIGSFSGGTFATGVGLGTPTPINLISFNGIKASETSNKLDWQVSCTDNRANTIELQRSNVNGNFAKIYSVVTTPQNCGNTFHYSDNSPMNGNNYYRLRLVDADGVVKYSNVVLLNNAVKGSSLISLAPNPAQSVTMVSINSVDNKVVFLTIVDATGRVVLRTSAALVRGINNLQLDVSRLVSGLYNVVLKDESGIISTQKLRKQ